MRRVLLFATPLLLAGLLAAWSVWDRFGPHPEGYGTVPVGGGEDELLGHLLAMTDGEALARPADPAKETSEEADVGGRPVKLSKGWQTNGKPCYEEGWADGKQHGRETWWDATGQKAVETQWSDGCLHGPETRWYANGQIAEEAGYDRCRLHGTHRTWHPGGTRSSQTPYRRGLRDGAFTAWHPGGAVRCRADFRKDALHGPWKEWDAAGGLVTQAEYRDGVCVSRTPGWGVEPFEYPGPLGAKDFAFSLAQGSGMHGFNALRVSAAGRCEFRYFFTSQQVSDGGDGVPRGEFVIKQVWRKAEFQLSGEEQRKLRDALRAADLFGLKDEYADKGVMDGTQWVVNLRAGGKRKRVYLSNSFPEPLRELSRAIREHVMAPHRMELVTATRAEGGGRSGDGEWLEDAK